MSNNNPTTKFKVDISELKSKIQQANRLIRLNNSEFKATTASMTDWSKSADGVSAKIKQLTGNIEQEKKKLESLEEQYRLTVKEQGEGSKGAQDLLIKINNQRAAIAKDEAQIKDYNEKLREMTGQENDTRTATDKLSDEINQQKDDLQKLKKKYADVVLAEGRNSESAQTLKTDIRKLSDKLYENKARLDGAREAADKLDSSLGDVSNASSDAADNGISSMNVALGNLAAEGISKVAGKLKEIAEETIAAGANFEAGMSNVAAISGANADELDKLTKKAEEMGANTKFSATEASQAFNYMAMAGWKSEDMLNGIEGIMDLAAASGEDLGTTSDIVTDALTAFGLQAKDSGRFADILAQASSNANTNVSMMGETFKYVAPVAGAMKYSAEDIAVAIGLMANSGIKATQAGTSLRSIITRLTAPTKQSGTSMEMLGISVKNADGSIKPFSQTLAEMREKFSKLSESEKSLHAKNIAGANAMSGFLALMNSGQGDVKKLTKSIKNADGASKRMAQTMQDNLQGEMTSLNSKIESIQIGLYKKFAPALKRGVRELKEFADSDEAQEMLDDLGDDLSNLSSKAVKFIKWTLENADKIAPVIKGIGQELLIIFTANKVNSFTSQVGSLINAFRYLKSATEGATTAQKLLNLAENSNPIGLVISIIGTLITAYETLTAVIGDTEGEAKELDLSPNAKEAKKEIDDLKKSYKDFKTERDNAVTETSAEWDYYESLRKELKKIVDKNGEVKKGYEDRADFITKELSKATDTEITIVDGEIKQYKKLDKQIKKVIQTQKAKSILSAYEGSYNAAIQNTAATGETVQAIASAQSSYNKDRTDYKNYSRRRDQANAEAEAAWKRYQSYKNPLSLDAKTALDQWSEAKRQAKNYSKLAQASKKSMQSDKQSLKTAQNILANYKATIENYQNLSTAISSGSQKKIQKALLEIQGDFVSANAGTASVLKNQVKNYKKSYEELQSAYKSGVEGINQTTVDQAHKLWQKAENEWNIYKKNNKTKAKESIKAGADGIKEATPKMTNAAEKAVDLTLGKLEQPEKFYGSGNADGQSWRDGFLDGVAGKKVKDVLKKQAPTKSKYNYGGLPGVGSLISGANQTLKSGSQSTSTVVNNYTTNSTNFYQTNNSPQPLSALDTYRNTKNLLKIRNGVK